MPSRLRPKKKREREGAMSYHTKKLAAPIENRKHHAIEAARLRALAATLTTPAIKARLLEEARTHARLAGVTADGER
jgi:hypothetical protein